MAPTRGDLERLAHKYRTLAALRRDRQAGAPIPPGRFFKALAGEFPGALHELDTLPLETIDDRAAALELAAGGGRVLPWMAWMHAYHRLMRAALRVKVRLARARDVDDVRAAALAEEATALAGAAFDAELVRAVARPPGGRIAPLILERVSLTFGVDPLEIADALFPRLRRGPRAKPPAG